MNSDGISAATLKHIIEAEQPSNLVDLFFRRTDMGWDHDQGRSRLESNAEIMAQVLGWDEARTQREIRLFHDSVEHDFPRYA